MKRSKKAALVLMAPVATLMLAGCGEKEQDVHVFHNVDECAAYYHPPAECQAEFAKAEALHTQVAPRYQNQQECETDFGPGQCETAPERHQSGSFFMPMMMGYMAGQMMNRGNLAGGQATSSQAASSQTTGSRGAAVPTQPLYKSRDDRSTFRTASNQAVATQPGAARVRPSAVQPQRARLVQRGGFGQQAAVRQQAARQQANRQRSYGS